MICFVLIGICSMQNKPWSYKKKKHKKIKHTGKLFRKNLELIGACQRKAFCKQEIPESSCGSFVISARKMFSILVWPMLTALWLKLDSKTAIFRGCTNFFQNYWIATQVIKTNVVGASAIYRK